MTDVHLLSTPLFDAFALGRQARPHLHQLVVGRLDFLVEFLDAVGDLELLRFAGRDAAAQG